MVMRNSKKLLTMISILLMSLVLQSNVVAQELIDETQKKTLTIQKPRSSNQQPTANSQRLTVNSKQSTAKSQQPMVNSQEPTVKSQKPKTKKEKVHSFIKNKLCFN